MEMAELACCENLWCGVQYAVPDGWDGYCPSCVALLDDHLARGHATPQAECVACRRTESARSHRAASDRAVSA